MYFLEGFEWNRGKKKQVIYEFISPILKEYDKIPKYVDIYLYIDIHTYIGFPGGSDSTESACIAGDPSLIPGLGLTTHPSILAWRIP